MVEQKDQWSKLSENLLQVVATLRPRARQDDLDVGEDAGRIRLAVERAEVVVEARYRWRPAHERTHIAEMVVTLLITTDNVGRAAGDDAAGVYVSKICNTAVELLGLSRSQSAADDDSSLDDFFAQLSPLDYELLAARFKDPRTIRELALAFGMTYAKTAQHLFRIFKKFRDHVNDRLS
jgi:hypothetical protein